MYEIKVHADRCDFSCYFFLLFFTTRTSSLQTMDASSAALQTARRRCSGIRAKPVANGCPMAGLAAPGGSSALLRLAVAPVTSGSQQPLRFH